MSHLASVIIEQLETRWMLSIAHATAVAHAHPKPSTAPVPPVETLSAVFQNAGHRGALFVGGRRGATTPVSLRVYNSGPAAAHGRLSGTFYLSADATLDAGDPVVGVAPAHAVRVAAGRATTLTGHLSFPAGTPAGAYHVFAVVDPAHTVAGNRAAGAVVLSPALVTLTNTPPKPARDPHHHGSHHDYGGGGPLLGEDDFGGYPIGFPSPEPETSPTTEPSGDSGDSGSSGGGASESGGDSWDDSDTTGGAGADF